MREWAAVIVGCLLMHTMCRFVARLHYSRGWDGDFTALVYASLGLGWVVMILALSLAGLIG